MSERNSLIGTLSASAIFWSVSILGLAFPVSYFLICDSYIPHLFANAFWVKFCSNRKCLIFPQ